MSPLPELASFLMSTLPLALLWVVTAVVALVRYRHHPPVSLLTLLACAVLLTNLVGGTILQWWLLTQNTGWAAAQGRGVLALLSMARAGLSTVGYALLVVALFGWRARPRRSGLELELDPLDRRPATDPDGFRRVGGGR
jgi:hypothetical protein